MRAEVKNYRPRVRYWRLMVTIPVVILAARGAGVVEGSVPLALVQYGAVAAIAVAGLARQGGIGGTATFGAASLVVIAAASALSAADPTATLGSAGLLLVFVLFGFSSAKRWADRAVLLGDVRWVSRLLTVVLAVGLVGHFTSAAFAAPATLDRYQGVLFNPNYAGIAAALAFLGTLIARVRAAEVLLLAPVSALALMLSGSRGAIAATLVGLLVLLLQSRSLGRLVPYLWGTGVALTVTAMLRPDFFGYITQYALQVRDASDPTSGRADIYSMFWNRFLEQPLLGVGFGGAELTLGSGSLRGSYVILTHNVYLTVLVELGIVGAVAFGIFLWGVVRSAGRQSPFAALFVAVLVFELTETTLFGFGNPVALVEWIAVFAYAASGSQLQPSAGLTDPIPVGAVGHVGGELPLGQRLSG